MVASKPVIGIESMERRSRVKKRNSVRKWGKSDGLSQGEGLEERSGDGLKEMENMEKIQGVGEAWKMGAPPP